MDPKNCWHCKSKAVTFVPDGGGNGVKCTKCGNALWHPNQTKEDAVRVWNWRHDNKGEDK